MSLLPRVLHLAAGTPSNDGAVAATLALLRYELNGVPPGSRAVVARLVDVLLVRVVRTWLRARPASDSSWLRALHDPITARALALLHETPARAWTIENLAAEVHISRATLTRRFTTLVGEPALTYLTRWRMDLAAQRLRETDDSVATIGTAVGYTSEHAFSRAFHRARGQPPHRYRINARTSATKNAQLR